MITGGWEGLIVSGFLFGFGFAMAQTLWGLLCSLVPRRNPPP